jgi:membrane protein DedA with SNARE-associated domain
MTAHITDWIAHHAIIAVFVLMAIDSVFPAAGELVMLFAGAVAGGAIAGSHVGLLGTTVASGVPAFVVLVATGVLGYLVGSWVGWAIGWWGGRELIERHGRWVHLGPERFARAERWFDRFEGSAVFLGRLTPLVRSFISIPAGTLGSRLVPYTLLTIAAAVIWNVAFAAAGWALGDSWDTVHRAFRYVDYAAVVVVVAVVVYLIVRARAAARTRRAAARPEISTDN